VTSELLAFFRYDAQTVYHLADKYGDIRSDTVVTNATQIPNNSSKPSFADALNSVDAPAKIAEKPKQKRKSTKVSINFESQGSYYISKLVLKSNLSVAI